MFSVFHAISEKRVAAQQCSCNRFFVREVETDYWSCPWCRFNLDMAPIKNIIVKTAEKPITEQPEQLSPLEMLELHTKQTRKVTKVKKTIENNNDFNDLQQVAYG